MLIYMYIYIDIARQGYCWLENVRGHVAENAPLESLSPISLQYKTGPLFQNEGAILRIKGQFCPWPLPKLSLIAPGWGADESLGSNFFSES